MRGQGEVNHTSASPYLQNHLQIRKGGFNTQIPKIQETNRMNGTDEKKWKIGNGRRSVWRVTIRRDGPYNKEIFKVKRERSRTHRMRRVHPGGQQGKLGLRASQGS